MNNRLSISDLAGLLAEKTGRKKKETEEFLKEFVSLVSHGVFEDRIVKIKEIGTFKIIEVEDRESIHVNTGERFVIPGHFKLTFTPDKELKELVNAPFSFFESVEVEDESALIESEEKKEEEISQEPEVVEEVEITVSEEPEEPEPTVPEQIEPEPIVAEPTQETDVTEPEKPRNKRFNWVLFITLIFLVLAGAFVYHFLIDSPSVQETLPVAAVAPQPEVVPTEMPEENEPTEEIEDSETVIAPVKEKQEEEVIARVVIEPGLTLTMIALEHYGHKFFWVYLYDYNKDHITNPNNIPIGTEIKVPRPELYEITRSREAIEKAAAIQAEIVGSTN
ncbi:nucleoid DNA-binding protein [Parabacteroides sp. PFB2-10]|uniref:HU family DNA-binding protein n=1 Tax=Parabacteroides sp. PFB2-10 TaxID=1742405 RepID=UPI002472F03A|nr:HU family DNA-binding protein [Parabacteroides sp. PFB2-10]MDH6311824.1 nucleoid DNA-binding protein [Parabacteroides sp. PFB2-10]